MLEVKERSLIFLKAYYMEEKMKYKSHGDGFLFNNDNFKMI